MMADKRAAFREEAENYHDHRSSTVALRQAAVAVLDDGAPLDDDNCLYYVGCIVGSGKLAGCTYGKAAKLILEAI